MKPQTKPQTKPQMKRLQMKCLQIRFSYNNVLIEKRCTGPCKKLKPPSEFHKHKCNTDGLSFKCGECLKIPAKSIAKRLENQILMNTFYTRKRV